MTEAEMQSFHEVYKAELLICKFQGCGAHESADALVQHAEANGISVHASALAVLARGPDVDDLLEHARM